MNPTFTNPDIATTSAQAAISLTERMQADGDEFRVRIMRKPSAGGAPETIAVVDYVTLEQVMNPEAWISLLAGGSQHYVLQVQHAKDKAGGIFSAFYQIPAIAGDTLPPNPRVAELPEWPSNMKIQFVPGMNKPKTQPGTNGKMGGSPSHEVTPTLPTGSDGGSALLLQLQREREALAEQRHRMELDAVRRESEAAMKAIESRIATMASQNHAPSFDLEKFIAAAGVVIAPIVAKMIEASSASRDREARAEEARLAREEKADEARQVRESSMMEKIATQSTESAKVIGVFTESLSTVARSMVQTVAMVGELRQEPPQDESLMGVLKVGIAAWAENASRAAQPPQMPQRQIAPPRAAPRAAPQPTEEVEEEVEMTASQMLDVLAQEIRELADPNDLAESIVESIGSPEFVTQTQHEGGLIDALRKRLGEAWAGNPANVAYVQRLFATVEGLAKSRGVDIAATIAPPAPTAA